MAEIAMVGGMVGDSLAGVTVRGQAALDAARRVVFPGDWIGDSLRESFGDRLRFGRSLTASDVVAIFQGVERGAILYAGSPRVFTGRPGAFPASNELASLLEDAGHNVRWFPGASFVELALDAAGLTVDVEARDALVVPPALVEGVEPGPALAPFLATHSTLVLLWAEDQSLAAYRALRDGRGGQASVAIVRGLGTDDEAVERGTLAELESSFRSLVVPAVVIVGPGVGAAPRRRPVVAVVGSARGSLVDIKTAEDLGEALVDLGCTIICGGLGGIMEAVCRGARRSPHYVHGATVGILPTYEPSDANPFCDIVVATGMNHARNAIVAASADAVAAVGGRAGTLTEIGFAWTLGRPVIAVEAEGWASRLAGTAIDDRRDDIVHGPFPPREAAACCVRLAATRLKDRKEFV